MEIYKVLHIYEELYGCEERPEGYVPTVEVVLCDSCGRETIISQEDEWLYSRNIREGDTVIIGENKRLEATPHN